MRAWHRSCSVRSCGLELCAVGVASGRPPSTEGVPCTCLRSTHPLLGPGSGGGRPGSVAHLLERGAPVWGSLGRHAQLGPARPGEVRAAGAPTLLPLPVFGLRRRLAVGAGVQALDPGTGPLVRVPCWALPAAGPR